MGTLAGRHLRVRLVMSRMNFTFYLFLLSGLANSQDASDSENGKDVAHCIQGEEASKEIKRWVKEVVEEETENYSIEFLTFHYLLFKVVKESNGT
eukprot:TRINITY_DN18358_c0_g1_i1.p1 TRINITY_DN18358_c0_g1~~TRINITY_DN18358_c0_g1_i1.p1  ORF type:complete len:103 (-),score=22.52 TRINITY_DN18358_c0_g1_i1:200-484(-)